jgi:hypothetical protein
MAESVSVAFPALGVRSVKVGHDFMAGLRYPVSIGNEFLGGVTGDESLTCSSDFAAGRLWLARYSNQMQSDKRAELNGSHNKIADFSGQE